MSIVLPSILDHLQEAKQALSRTTPLCELYIGGAMIAAAGQPGPDVHNVIEWLVRRDQVIKMIEGLEKDARVLLKPASLGL